jgi:hypothetical protein
MGEIAVVTIWLLINIQYHPSKAVKGVNTRAFQTENACKTTLDRERPTLTGDAWCLPVELKND